MAIFKGRVENGQCFIFVHVYPPNSRIEYKDVTPCRALIDTGAQNTCISQKLASYLKLVPVSKIEVLSAAGHVSVNQYLVGLVIPIERLNQLSVLGSPATLVTEFQANTHFDVLIGMDMLAECTLFVARGEFFLSY